MNKRLLVVFSLSMLALLVQIALVAAEGPTVGEIELASSQDVAQSRAAVAVTQHYTSYMPLVSVPNPVLFFDGFESTDGGWPIADSGDVLWFYRLGQYIMSIERRIWWAGAVPDLPDLDGYRVAADMYIPTGVPGFYGLVFDRLDWDRFYVFVVEPGSRSYAVLRHDLGPSPWDFVIPFDQSAAINGENGINRLAVERKGSQFKIFANGVLLDSAVDGTYSGVEDEAGLFAQSIDVIPTSFHFDNFEIVDLGLAQGLNVTMPSIASPTVAGQGLGIPAP